MASITDRPRAFGDNTLDFSWTPTLANLSYSIGGTVYTTNAPKTAVNTAITFTAVAVAPSQSGRSFVKYEWDFGDGSKGFGPVVVHTFKVANPLLRVRCCATDNRGVKICVGRQIYLT